MVLTEGRILENSKLAEPNYYRLLIESPVKLHPRPGQFLQIRVSREHTDPLLRRPFSFAGFSGKGITIFYQVRGKGTAILARRRCGEKISFLGPLGNPYPVIKGPKLLLAGGLGAAGLLFLAKRLLSRPTENQKVWIVLGGKTREALFYLPDFQSLGFPVFCSTEDGTFGSRGLATSALEKLSRKLPGKTILYACGPNSMLARANEIAGNAGWKAYFSLETMLACGLGICGGCAVPTKNGFRLVCADGPVFPADQIIWNKYA